MDNDTADYFQRRPWLFILLLTGLCVSTTYIYWPGLEGIFLLDDYSSIVLAARYYPDLWMLAISKLIQGEFPGRPLAMLSFALNMHEWPQSAWGFKYTNLGLHLMTGLVGLWFIMALLARSSRSLYTKHHITIALMVAGLWLVHPLNVSTTLYIVQRMTILSTLFSLAALVAFIHGRDLLHTAPRRGWTLLLIVYPLLITLGFLCKENAILAIPLTLLVDSFLSIGKKHSLPKYFRIWKFCYLLLPIFILIIHFIIQHNGIVRSFQPRDFTLTERLLTESRILVEYIFRILIPSSRDITIFHDDIEISRSFLNPISTLASTIFLSVIIASSFLLRKRYPLFFFTTFWFFISHALESTFFPLELYFEHRNYTAAFGPLLLACLGFMHLRLWIRPFATALLYSSFFMVTAFTTANAASIWGNVDLFARFNYQNHPHSERATEFYANYFRVKGQINLARHVLTQYLENEPKNAGVLMLQLSYRCLSENTDSSDLPPIDILLDTLTHSTHNFGAVETLTETAAMIATNKCPLIPSHQLINIIDALLNNPAYQRIPVSMHNLYIAKANLYAKERNLNATVSAIENAIYHKKVISSYILAANILFSANRPDLAETFLIEAQKIDKANDWPLRNSHKVLLDELLSLTQPTNNKNM